MLFAKDETHLKANSCFPYLVSVGSCGTDDMHASPFILFLVVCGQRHVPHVPASKQDCSVITS